ncbi:MAG: hypothetical protein LBU89_05085 [Fibromonadaceae bacterium]|jgi:predicted Zn-dependent protease with MMP-like domain|nr:hypothetical protein [Fibromonadaceae bacterium]
MKNRIASMPFSSIPQDMRLLAKNILVFFDDKQQDDTLKRIAIINEKENKALIIDSLEHIGIINVMGNSDGYGNILWIPRERIGLLRRLSAEKLLEKEPKVTNQKIVNAVLAICHAEKSTKGEVVISADVFELARLYIERYPLTAQAGS